MKKKSAIITFAAFFAFIALAAGGNLVNVLPSVTQGTNDYYAAVDTEQEVNGLEETDLFATIDTEQEVNGLEETDLFATIDTEQEVNGLEETDLFAAVDSDWELGGWDGIDRA
jgi:hypothetical protein